MNRTPRSVGTAAAARKALWERLNAESKVTVAAGAAKVHGAPVRKPKGPKRDSKGRFLPKSAQ